MDTGWLNLALFSSVTSGSSGGSAWSSPGNAGSSDNLYASVGCAGPCSFTSQWLIGQNVGSVVPDDAIINGIEILMEGYIGIASDIANAGIVKGGVVQETVLIDPAALTTSDTIVYAGGETELWGLSWLGTDINAVDFGVALYANGGAGIEGDIATYIDHMQVKIYYDENSAMLLTI